MSRRTPFVAGASCACATAALSALLLSASPSRAQILASVAPRPVRASVADRGAGHGTGTGGGAAASAARVLPTARRYVGVRYRWGGTSPRRGFDCSGYVRYVFARHGVRLPRTSRQQARAGLRRAPTWKSVAPGDLVMFAEPGRPISHVAIYVGGRRIIHASASGGGVRYDHLDTKRGRWYRTRLVAVRRVTVRGRSIARVLLDPSALAAAEGGSAESGGAKS